MDGENDGESTQAALADEQEPQGNQAQALPVGGGDAPAGGVAATGADYAAAGGARRAHPPPLEADIVQKAKTDTATPSWANPREDEARLLELDEGHVAER